MREKNANGGAVPPPWQRDFNLCLSLCKRQQHRGSFGFAQHQNYGAGRGGEKGITL
ncbi:hypothetical protein Z948_3098 [Sulfitobacter donghicola DSW-25 = KCTC 12864 = JCM 14565]|nr:hypothetical protein Z948_3098 [Sulfitobacter donghicola DSW-25 = KCTC 12864 = JCM 14565]